MLSVFTSYFLPNQTKFCKLKADRSDFRFVFVQEKERKEKKKKKRALASVVKGVWQWLSLEDGFVRPPSWRTVVSPRQLNSAAQSMQKAWAGVSLCWKLCPSWQTVWKLPALILVQKSQNTSTGLASESHQRCGIQHYISFWPFKERHPWVAPLFISLVNTENNCNNPRPWERSEADAWSCWY